MSVGPLGMLGSVAGSHLPQTKGSEVDRAQQETSAAAREAQANQKAESASGVGEAEEDQQASERDADGRRLWEPTTEKAPDPAEAPPAGEAPRSKDPDGDRGVNLDLSG